MQNCSQSFDSYNDCYFDYLSDYIQNGSLKCQMDSPPEQVEDEAKESAIKVEVKMETPSQPQLKIKEQKDQFLERIMTDPYYGAHIRVAVIVVLLLV